MQVKYMISDSDVHVIRMNEETTLDKLPAQVYTVKYSQLTGFYLGMYKDKLELPDKIYGNTQERVDRCITSYKERSASTGVLMTGDKGTGKTLLMSLLANTVIEQLDQPVLLINEPYSGSQFLDFIESVGECCLVFDEFGKMYSSNSKVSDDNMPKQNSLLNLMDGVDKTKRLIIITENREYDINEFMLNRPSRVYYHFRYKKLDEASIIGYCDDNGIDKNTTEDILELSRRSRLFSFDMLQSIVEEHKRFSITVDEVAQFLNVDLSESIVENVEIVKVFDKKDNIVRSIIGDKIIQLSQGTTYLKLTPLEGADKDDYSDNEFYDYVGIHPNSKVYETNDSTIYENDDFRVIVRDAPTYKVSYANAL